MTEKTLTKIMRSFLVFGGIYLLFEGIIHLSPLRLSDVVAVWPTSSLVYANWMGHFYGSFSLLSGLILLVIQKNIRYYKNIIKITGFFALFHAALLIYAVLTAHFDTVYRGYPSLTVGITFYNTFVVLEAVLLLCYAFLIYVWQKHYAHTNNR